MANESQQLENSPPPDTGLLPLLPGPEAEITWEQLTAATQALAMMRGHYAGYPLPDEDHELVLSPKMPLFESMNGAKLGPDEPSDDEFLATLDESTRARLKDLFAAWKGGKIVNHWFSERRQTDVIVWRNAAGKSKVRLVQNGPGKRANMLIGTMGVARCWEIEAEAKAMQKLADMVPRHIFDYYALTGSFLERSDASGVIYIFRRCRPTLALSTRKDASSVVALCCLCLHTVGYYAGTFGGAMVPTDDVITHLTMMRGDERRYWSQCNQHSVWLPEAGL